MMGVNDRANERKAEKARGAAKGQGRRSTAFTPVEMSLMHWIYVMALTQATIKHGGAIRTGLTRDGGAWSLGMYLGEDYGTEYVKPDEDFGDAVAEIATAWFPDKGAAYFEILTKLYDDAVALKHTPK